ncbi:hypothetical protein [Wolbachia endosymbiont (group A) of Crataerina pallida]|uniref:hypothetical protein n=1 Tax=Wolbachia endosymbiont (group A) of Crataerina pallida TaxID=3066144 RepID=UPI00333F3447
MPNISEVNRELVKAFNINLRFNSIAVTNLTVQNLHGKDHIVISFDKNMNSKQCMKYLNNMKEKIIKRSYKDEKVAGVSYNTEFFPFTFNTKHLPRDNKERKKFSVEIDEEVVFNLKCYLAQALAGDVKEGMGKKRNPKYLRKHIYDTSFDRDSYLYCMLFRDKGLQKDFVDSFLAEIEGYPNPPSDYLEVKGNLVYIKKGIFDDIEFIKDIIAYNTSLECRYLQTPSAKNKTVDKLKYTIIDFIDRVADIPVRTITRTSYVNSKEDSVLIPLVQNGKFLELLTEDDAYNLSRVFDDAVVTKIKSHHLKNPYWSDNEVYAIDFSDVNIAYCVLNKIIESSVINKDHELSVDPELPRTLLAEASPTQEFPTQSQGEELGRSPRQGLEESFMLHKKLDVPGTSGEFLPRSHLSYTAVSQGTEKCVSAAQNVQAGPSTWSQPMNPLLSQSTSGNKWTSSTQFTQPGPSGSSWTRSEPSSSKGAEADDESMPIEIRGQQVSYRSSGPYIRGGKRMQSVLQRSQMTYRSSSIPSPRAWDSSTFLNLEVSNEESEKQQVTDKSDLESNDECSKAKPQSESPSSRKGSESNSFSGSSTLSKKSIMPELEKLFILELEKWFLYFQQNGKKLDSTRSTHELSSKKTATSSERKVKSNSPSKVTSPVTETYTKSKLETSDCLNDSISELPSQGAVGKAGDRSSKASIDSGIWSLERGQSPSLIEEFSDSLQQTPLIVDKLENIFSKLLSVVHNLLKNPASPTHKDVSGGLKLQQHLDSDQREKLYKALSSKMKKKLDSELFLPEYEKLLYLLYVDKREVRLLLSPPGEVEQVCSVLPSEEKEQAQSSSSEEVVRLFQEFFSNQKVSDNYLTSSKDSGVSLGSSSQKSTSDTGSDEDELEASGRSSVSSNSSTSTVRTKMDATKIEQYLQEKKVNSRT